MGLLVYSNFTPYKHIGVEGLGLVVENTDSAWYSGIRIHIEDVNLRCGIESRACSYLYKNRFLEDNIHELCEILKLIMDL